MDIRNHFLVVVTAFILAVCSSSQRIDADQEAADADADSDIDADGDTDADINQDADNGADDSDVECSGDRHGRTITITNGSSQIEHYDFQAPLTFAWQDSGSWVEVLPWLGWRTTCDECEPIFPEPCDPTLRALAPGESQSYEWDGLMSFPDDERVCDWNGGEVSCLDRIEAPPGRYRVEVCHSATYVAEEEEFGSCYGVEGYVSPASLDNPECATVEFDYDPCEAGDVVVTL